MKTLGLAVAAGVGDRPRSRGTSAEALPARLGDARDLYRRSKRQAQVLVAKARRRRGHHSETHFVHRFGGLVHNRFGPYDREGKLWKTIATFNAYGDRPVPDARVAIYPFKRMFQTALVDEDVQDGCSTVVYMPGHETEERQCWYINMSIVTK
jgi:hypothetical protein